MLREIAQLPDVISEKLGQAEQRFEELNQLLADPDVLADYERLQELGREQSALQGLVLKFREFKRVGEELRETLLMHSEGSDDEMASLIEQEVEALQTQHDNLIEDLTEALRPRDLDTNKDVIMEIRAGTGGEEAAIFAADLYRMYAFYAQGKKCEVNVIDSSEASRGGFKEIIFEVRGKGVYGKLKHESGVHRVQRVPVTEASGRIHTSTATVAVLPEAEEVEVDVNPNDIRTDIFHSGGPGGQNVNKVATAVRLTHFPSGIVVVCQDERSQLQNRIKAMTVLRTRLLDMAKHQRQEEQDEDRRSQVGTGERAEKIRTYNFPQDRVTDHRLGQSFHNIPAILRGEIDDIIDALVAHEEAERAASESLASPSRI